jgi:hypothetical protein
VDIQWNFHPPYNPIISGNIEKWNGLLKLKLASINKTDFQTMLNPAAYELNSRPRLNRASPFEETS